MGVRKIDSTQRCALRMTLAAGSLLVLATIGARAEPTDPRGCPPEFHGPPGPPGPPPPGLPGPGEFGSDRPPPYLRDMDLSEDQQDKLFEILHAAAPALREQARAAFKARESLRNLSQSSGYSEAAATAIARTAAEAETQLSMLRARIDHDIYSLLTPEQRDKLKLHGPQHDPRLGAGPWRP